VRRKRVGRSVVRRSEVGGGSGGGGGRRGRAEIVETSLKIKFRFFLNYNRR
jgi:hypothetical protein